VMGASSRKLKNDVEVADHRKISKDIVHVNRLRRPGNRGLGSRNSVRFQYCLARRSNPR
jgi:hypothetical protein